MGDETRFPACRVLAYIDGGYWSQLAITEARLEGPVEVLWSGKNDHYTRLPTDAELDDAPAHLRPDHVISEMGDLIALALPEGS